MHDKIVKKRNNVAKMFDHLGINYLLFSQLIDYCSTVVNLAAVENPLLHFSNRLMRNMLPFSKFDLQSTHLSTEVAARNSELLVSSRTDVSARASL
ncbi:hypothetical protein CEXT_733941 [Caerostris extrusa]|uniref:Uncharacterized protein n=1 Tax=Caerostris extrusa TaxID=172846 RepID=A0AAV4WED1_CAEEX|nr:hypothetical protein CEXT_733941 [Caerostris extrusa]